MPAIPDLLLTLIAGAALGLFGGLFGIGGGIIAVPLLSLGLGMPQSAAQGTALALMTPNLLIAWWRYHQRLAIDWRDMLAIAVPGMLTTWGLAIFATRLNQAVLRIVFGAFLILLSLRLLRTSRRAEHAGELALHGQRWRLPLVGMVGGSSMGLLGIGGSLLATPLLVGWLRQRQARAQGLALALVAPSAAVALATYAKAQQVDWGLGLPLAAGGLFTVSAGVALAHKLPERRMRKAFALVMLATGIWLASAGLR